MTDCFYDCVTVETDTAEVASLRRQQHGGVARVGLFLAASEAHLCTVVYVVHGRLNTVLGFTSVHQ